MRGDKNLGHVYESPSELNAVDSRLRLFLAGGITGCADWQSQFISMIWDLPLAIFNPRRENFPIHDPTAAKAQIEWEHKYLLKANCISFWFPSETLCPIVLYELGAWSAWKGLRGHKQIFIGVDPEYKRRQDVEIQTSLVRPEVQVVYSLEDLAFQIREYAA